MNNKERIHALLHGERPDRVPVWPFAIDAYSALSGGYTIADSSNNPGKALKSQKEACQRHDWVFCPLMGYASFGAWELGGEIRWPTGEFDQAPIVTRHAVDTEEDVFNLTVPDIATSGFIPILTEFIRLVSLEDHSNMPFTIQASNYGSFSFACNAAGTENMMRWMLKRPEVAHRLLRISTDYTFKLIDYWYEQYGVEGVLAKAGEATTANQMISPKHFKEFAVPYLIEVYEKLRVMGYKHIYCHICGDQNKNLPHWAEINLGDPGILSFGHEIDILTAAEFFPQHIILGNIDPVILLTETPEGIYEAARVCIEKGKQCPGGFILSPGCQLPPNAPIENVEAMTQAAIDFGHY